MNYLTKDQSCIKEHLGLGTKKIVKVNTHESKFVLLKDISESEWLEIVDEFQNLIYVHHENKIANESPSDLYKIFLYDKNHNSAFSYIQTDFLKKQFKLHLNFIAKDYKDLLRYLKKISVEEQIILWKKIRPNSHLEYECSMRTRYLTTINPLNIIKIGEKFSFIEGVNYLISLLSRGRFSDISEENKNNPFESEIILAEGFKQRALQLLVHLQQLEVILFSIGTYLKLKNEISQNFYKKTNTGLITSAILNSPKCNNAILTFLKGPLASQVSRDDKESSIFSAWFLMSTTINDIGDLSTSLIEEATEYKIRHYKWFQSFIDILHNDPRYKNLQFPSPRRISKNSKGENAKSRSLAWARKDLPHLINWINLFEIFNTSRYITYSTTIYSNSSYILKYLSMLDVYPEPNKLNGNLHIRNVELGPDIYTIRNFLDDWVIETGPNKGNSLDNSTKCTVLNYWRNVMDYFCSENILKITQDNFNSTNLLTKNPICEIDCKWKIEKSNRTHRDGLRQDYVDMAKEILLSPDKNGNPTFQWVMNLPTSKNDWIEFPRRSSVPWKWVKNDGNRTKYWQPSKAILLYLMLEIPMRSFQARMIDSGIADEFIWQNGKYIKNRNVLATKGRKLGVIQPIINVNLTEDELPGIYVSTNKTQIWNPEDFKGILIPWSEEGIYKMMMTIPETML